MFWKISIHPGKNTIKQNLSAWEAFAIFINSIKPTVTVWAVWHEKSFFLSPKNPHPTFKTQHGEDSKHTTAFFKAERTSENQFLIMSSALQMEESLEMTLTFSVIVFQLCSKPAAWSSTPSSSSRASTWESTTSSTGATAWPGVGPSFPSAEGSSTVSTPQIMRSFTHYDLSPWSNSNTSAEGLNETRFRGLVI